MKAKPGFSSGFRKAIWGFLFMVCAFSANATSPSTGYYFSEPEFTQLLPFSSKQTALFKKLEIKRVRLNGHTEWFLNEAGLPTRMEEFRSEKKRSKISSTGTYLYNERNQLVKTVFSNSDYKALDSLAYDRNGRLIFFHRSVISLTGKEKDIPGGRTIDYTYSLLDSNETGTVIGEKWDNGFIEYHLDNQNQIRKIKSSSHCDSISTDTLSQNNYVKSYWHKGSRDSIFQLGKKVFFEEGRKVLETIYWQRFGKKESPEGEIYLKRNYLYGADGQIRRIEPDHWDDLVLFIYRPAGLLQERGKLRRSPKKKVKYFQWQRYEYFQY